ncbi:MAG: hypothetical protein V4691_07980 [Pseudomonadota bacterium]
MTISGINRTLGNLDLPAFGDWNRAKLLGAKLFGLPRSDSTTQALSAVKRNAAEKCLQEFNENFYAQNKDIYARARLSFDKNVFAEPAVEALPGAWRNFARQAGSGRLSDVLDAAVKAIKSEKGSDKNDDFDLAEVIAWNRSHPDAPLFGIGKGEQFFYDLSQNGKEISISSLAKFFDSQRDLPNGKLSHAKAVALEPLFPDLASHSGTKGTSSRKLAAGFIGDWESEDDFANRALDFSEAEGLIYGAWNKSVSQETAYVTIADAAV